MTISVHSGEKGLGHWREDALIPTRTEPKTVADVLTAAADLIDQPGAWTQGAFKRGSGRGSFSCCGVGAIYHVTYQFGHLGMVAVDLLDAWARRRKFPHFAAFNDAEERTQAEVVAALRKAAEKARTADHSGRAGDDGAAGVNQTRESA